jgi:hypothetical protein
MGLSQWRIQEFLNGGEGGSRKQGATLKPSVGRVQGAKLPKAEEFLHVKGVKMGEGDSNGGGGARRPLDETGKTEALCQGRCGTIKIPPCSKALSAEHRPKFCSPSPAMVTPSYK